MNRRSPVASDLKTRRDGHTRQLERAIVRFQEASYQFDEVAAQILALPRADLPCMTLLLFGGPQRVDDLSAALQAKPAAVAATVARLELAGYARREPGAERRVALTEHAGQWIGRIWEPLQREGQELLGGYSVRDLALLDQFVQKACEIQEAQTHTLRSWLDVPAMKARRTHLRGGLSPAALRRVQLFVDANLGGTVRLKELASRASLSPFHFARAFRTTTGTTPRAFVEERRIARAKQLIDEGASSLATIALDTGFGSQSQLTTSFRRRTGFTPAQYRRGGH